MDGNGRWAKKRGLIRSAGHERGGNQVRTILREAYNLGVKQLTLYAFSSENWKRPKAEVSFLFNLLVKFLKSETEQLNKDNVFFSTIGDLTQFPDKVQNAIQNSNDGLLNNKTFLVTGKLNGISKAEVKSLIEENSGKTISSVSKKLNFLIIGEKPTKKKVDYAKQLKIKVIDQAEFLKMLNKSS